jgi:hypothetical protein
MTDQERQERIQARDSATIPVVGLAVIVAYFALTQRAHPIAPLLGGVAAVWGLFLLLQYRYSWSLLISALVMVLGGASLWLGR